MKIAVLTYGTRGDVQPYVVLADHLASRGHDVAVAVCTNLVPMVAAAGLDAVPIPIDSYEFFASREGREILAAGDTRKFLAELGRREAEQSEAFDDALLTACSDANVVVASVLTLARARSITEAAGQRLVPALTLPIAPTGDYASPYLVPGRDVPGRLTRRLTHVVFEAAFARSQRPALLALRRRLGLPGAGPNPFSTLRRSGPATYHLVSDVLLPTPADWPASIHQVGQPEVPAQLREAWGETGVPDDLQAWLDAGPAPVFFGFGSMPVLDPAATMDLIGSVPRDLGVRALVGAGWSGVEAGSRADDVHVVTTVDHDAVLPHCRAAVHHGGSGTTQSVLRAGLPAVVAHVFADQSLWGLCLRRQGLGETLAYRALDRTSLGAALGPLLGVAAVARVRTAAERMSADQPLEHLVRAVESL